MRFTMKSLLRIALVATFKYKMFLAYKNEKRRVDNPPTFFHC